ncbi:hypothetical protein [Bradyrhizobium japonicum]|nr:hypothetical protein [Bradyrhizobium japonicum]
MKEELNRIAEIRRIGRARLDMVSPSLRPALAFEPTRVRAP